MHRRIKAAIKPAARFFVSVIKPTALSLVFLLASVLFPASIAGEPNGFAIPAEVSSPAPSHAAASPSGSAAFLLPCHGLEAGAGAVFGLLAKAQLPMQKIAVGRDVFVITRHAAIRMAERRIGIGTMKQVLKLAKPFPYAHAGIEKIGYYDSDSRVFIAVAKAGRKIITVISGVPEQYVNRLIDRIAQ